MLQLFHSSLLIFCEKLNFAIMQKNVSDFRFGIHIMRRFHLLHDSLLVP